MIYGYCRVSSKGQLEGNSLEQQEEEIKARYRDAKICKEQFTGATANRPIFNYVLSQLKEGDTLVVTKLDRFCRKTKEGLEVIEELKGKGINIHILNMGLIEDSPMGELIVTCLLAFAQFERNMIVERTQSGKEIAKKNPDYREGRPRKYTKKQMEHARELKDEGHSYKEVTAMTGISKCTLYRYIQGKMLEEGTV